MNFIGKYFSNPNPSKHPHYVRRRRSLLCIIISAVLTAGSFMFFDGTAYGDNAETAGGKEDPISLSLKIFSDSHTTPSATYEHITGEVSAWAQNHPEVILHIDTLRYEDYDSELSYYASQNALPDMFLLRPNSVGIWSSQDYLADLSEVLTAEDFADSRIQPFLRDGKAYTFPAFSDSPILIAYDKDAFLLAGLPIFPETWEELIPYVPIFQKMGYSAPLGFYSFNAGNLVTYLGSRIFAENCGLSWQVRLLSGDEILPYLDDGIPDVLREIQMLEESNIFYEDNKPIEAFQNGECPAVILTLDDIPSLENALQQSKNIGYALIPVSEKSPYKNEVYSTITTFMGYALAINKNTADDPARMAACVDFGKTISGYAAENSLESADYPESVSDLLSSVQTLENPACYASFTCITSALNTFLKADVNEYTAREIANTMQDCYEKVRY